MSTDDTTARMQRDALVEAVIGDQDYLNHPEAEETPALVDADAAYRFALQQAGEMHRLLLVRAQLLYEAHDTIVRIRTERRDGRQPSCLCCCTRHSELD